MFQKRYTRNDLGLFYNAIIPASGAEGTSYTLCGKCSLFRQVEALSWSVDIFPWIRSCSRLISKTMWAGLYARWRNSYGFGFLFAQESTSQTPPDGAGNMGTPPILLGPSHARAKHAIECYDIGYLGMKMADSAVTSFLTDWQGWLLPHSHDIR